MIGDEDRAKKASRSKLQSSLKATPGLIPEMCSDLRHKGQLDLARRNSRKSVPR